MRGSFAHQVRPLSRSGLPFREATSPGCFVLDLADLPGEASKSQVNWLFCLMCGCGVASGEFGSVSSEGEHGECDEGLG